MAQTEIQDMSQGEAAYQKLHQAIRAGVFKPGDRLREIDVADRLSLSRTPVREALRKLENEGIVEHRARIGAVIRTLSQTEVVELYEMRVVLERTAAEMAAKHISPAEIDFLEYLNTQIHKARGEAPAAAAINHDFHRCIYEATRNRFLQEAARGLNNALLLLGPTTLADDARIEIVCKQHATIITAIRGGDSDAAGDAAETHLQTSLRHRLKVMNG
ncbi:GntR family transcriptional regulator [Pelagimonas varians]|uniref:Putative HTH-type transcriptional regulator YdfH n=1 Tax=Pelagimonas varians TaxID=696760 RepID=A0A238KCX9_9RHOB|nr:GntR family transcriptional regulator [Pelagimonas varians]PYG29945.1 GntR family transcriptional regulator [Pelagimonas varians]SMX40685.1 putative HTH-type transcriptional regulator YdfH [Pelagimonas varians]